MTNPSDQFRDLRELLTTQCLLGQVHYRIWRAINESSRDKPEIAESAPVFFIMTRKAHFDGALIHVARLVDKHSESTSIHHYLSFAESNALIFQKVTPTDVNSAVESDRASLEGMSRRISNITARRNKYYAHLDKALISGKEEVLADFPIAPKEIYDLLVEIGEILNRYSGYFDDSDTHMGVLDEDDVNWVMDSLGKSLEREREERQRLR